MMAHGVLPSPPTQPRRVKVYELKNNDWFDRGTGYCTGHLMDVRAQLLKIEGPWILGRELIRYLRHRRKFRIFK